MTETTEALSRVMVVAAHPDDPEFGCGGTIAKWAAAGKEFTYIIITNGDKGTHDPSVKSGDLALTREKEQWDAARVLGVQEVVFLGYPDQTLENSMALRRQLAGLVRQYRPHIIMAIDPWRLYQLHPDHRAAGFAALDAIYAARECHVFSEQFRDSIGPWRVSEAYLYWTSNPDYWEDVTAYIDQRIESLLQHVSQVRDPDKLGPRIRERTAKTSQEAGLPYEYAEALKRLTF